jgi:NAD+ synthase
MDERGERRAAHLAAWLRAQISERGARGAVVNLSGGIDSAVVAGLLRRALPAREAVLALILPCHSSPQDGQDAMAVARAFGIPTRTVELGPVYDAMVRALGEAAAHRLAAANIKPRLRMIAAYAEASARGFLVVGTGNRSELAMGYFTKYGDGGVDLLPLGGLTKHEVREVARALGVPQAVIDRPPSAGLWEGQTDEDEMGFTYAELDRYLLTGEAPDDLRQKFEARHAAAQHKMAMPPIAPPDPVGAAV